MSYDDDEYFVLDNDGTPEMVRDRDDDSSYEEESETVGRVPLIRGEVVAPGAVHLAMECSSRTLAQ